MIGIGRRGSESRGKEGEEEIVVRSRVFEYPCREKLLKLNSDITI